ncbi:DGQHR domain-containing protein [Paraburkholderia sp. BL27I4N3]|uniref:DGQHR domain-containing protein n=1 Tax=Paraburkholderia sp. BL27I4N3 TaxID=1938805 RepID=UPI000E268C61|nr:DGQHR domain-containing protein [Paraburkholderia sp. BL27I4N3]REE06555.1 DGQHR domain-containing protein [Paraburkholderia sp. BL27I4N3]
MITTKKVSKIKKLKSYQAFSFQQRSESGPSLVMFHAPVKEIQEWAAVAELSPTTRGPQREQKEARVQAIAKFLKADDQNTIPTALILAFVERRATFTKPNSSAAGKSNGLLSIELGSTPAATIVDGQHRLFGIDSFDPDMEVAVVALLETDRVERAFQFLVINNKSSRVPATHTKALLATMKNTSLALRLKGARLAFDVEGIKDVDLINSDIESPFFKTIDWSTTPQKNRIVQATSIEISLDYIAGLGVPEYSDRDICRSVFLVIWKAVKTQWPSLWVKDSRLLSKIGIICLSRFIADRITNWADNDDLNIEVTDLEEIESQTDKIIKYMDPKFWTTPWAEKAQGGFDTNQGRERVMSAIIQLYRNGRRGIAWYTDIDIIERSAARE